MAIDNGEPFDLKAEIFRITTNRLFGEWAQASAMKMVTGLFADSGRTWREAARNNSRGREIYDALRNELDGPVGWRVNELIEFNASLIRSLPLDLATDVVRYAQEEAMKGRRWEAIAAEIPELFGQNAETKAALIARTETSKAHTALVQARAENLGIDFYVWKTSKDSRVRSSHAHMEGVIVRWDDPPSPEALIGENFVGNYHAGNIWNCRCFCQPLYDADLISWPHKVYFQGDIVIMTRSRFEKMAA